MKSAPARPDVGVDGHPELVLLDGEREAIAELVAEMLLAALGPVPAGAAPVR